MPLEGREGQWRAFTNEHGVVSWWSEEVDGYAMPKPPVHIRTGETWRQVPLDLGGIDMTIEARGPYVLVTSAGSHPNLFDLRTGEAIAIEGGATMTMFWPVNAG